ncbi:response regulator [Bizionia paragorgiae]|uniref:response regulator n=1 Tax=Bizionia paragorgiae TaxID=283786 RepID=UPI003A95D988
MTRVLLIEDDKVLRENTAEILELANYEVSMAPNGVVGLDYAKKHLPDIIICDIMMPELDGYDTLKALSENEKTKYIPFIFLSAKTEREDVRVGMNLGADDYITKPFSEPDLINAIESRIAKTSILRELKLADKEEDSEPVKSINDLKNICDEEGALFSFKKDEVIYREGEHSNHIYLINKGVVKCYQSDAQGKELITALYKEDDFFGYNSFTNSVAHKTTAVAIEDVELSGVPTKYFNRLLSENSKLALEFIQHMSDNLLLANKQLLEMAYGSVNRKTAKTILKFAEKINRKPEDPINISRSDLASVAGIATETLIRTLTRFKKEGAIAIEGRNIRVLDLEMLKRMF